MNFATLTKDRSSGGASVKVASSIEYRCATGAILCPGISICDEITVIRGDGKIDFRRRGDFGEREDFPPGAWSSMCEVSQVEKLWEQMGRLGPVSFPARVADPGDTMQYLTGYAKGRVHGMTIPPTDDSKPVPGDAFFQELYPVLDICEKGQCHWAVESSLIKVVQTPEGAEAEIRFRNPGSRSIGLVFDGNPGASDFHFRYAQDREDLPYPEWHHCDSLPANSDSTHLLALEPGSDLIRRVSFQCVFPDSGKYIGKIGYRQSRFLDSLAGVVILTGVTHTEIAEFSI
jgi:hypothetical protein